MTKKYKLTDNTKIVCGVTLHQIQACGCFNGKIEEFLKRVEETHENNEHAQAYKILAEIAKLRIGGK